MKTELRYLVVLLSILLASISGMVLLLRKYSYLTLQHFVEFCKETTGAFLSSGVHFIGLLVLLTTFLLVLLFSTKLFFSLIKTRRKIQTLLTTRKKNLPVKIRELLSNLEIKRNKIVVIGQTEPLALNFGLFSPKILISTGLIRALSKQELAAVLLHEIYHLRNRHPLILIFGELIAAVFFFIPLMKELVLHMRLSFEQKADEFAIRLQGSSLPLKTALAKNIDRNSLYPYPGFADELLERRIDLLRGNKIRGIISLRSIVLSVMTVIAGLVLFLFPTSTHASLEISAGNRQNSACQKINAKNTVLDLTKCKVSTTVCSRHI